MYRDDIIEQLELDALIDDIEEAETYIDELHLEEIFPQGNIWAASPEEIAEIIEEYPHLAEFINL